jgi:peptidoglycan-N-acetylglucosamine deacetylase
MGQSGMSLRNSAFGLRSLIPQAARERLYAWHPGRARRWQAYPGLERVEPGGHAVLTFDDGPDPDATPAVLDALDRTGVRATFFLLGTQVESHPALAREVVERGHEIALHGYGHERQDRIDSDRTDEDMRRGYSVLEKQLGVQCRWYRPPYGKMSDGAARTCASLGMSVVYWSAWGLDWEEVCAARIADVVSDQLDDGGILLLHDSARHARRASAAPTADAIEIIAENARERGMALISLGEALAYAGSVA